jgi:hypothetical protein
MTDIAFEHDPDPWIEELRSDVGQRRSAGVVLFAIKKHGFMGRLGDAELVQKVVDAFVAEMGCTGLSTNWLEIDRPEAHWVLTHVLWADLAYSAAIMTRDEAMTLAGRFQWFFMDTIYEGCRYYTNSTWTHRMVPLPDPTDCLDGSWPITDASFDAGVIIVSPERIGMLWVKDED